ncbi:MAG: PD-(D/E)XK nuclease family protein, partial [Actinomycetia bacterium]|nr:PD-(D/E)XK nuclease family protein [Actinomycetes bacterium]
LRVLADQGSGPALARLLTGARWRIGPGDLAALSRRAGALAARRRAAVDETGGPDRPTVEDGADDDPASLVEALDDLGPASDYSPDGHRRLSALSAELGELRRAASTPLPDLVAEVARRSGLDIEVAARPGPAQGGRAHLDRFLDEAARFVADAEQATLPAFLAFCEAAAQEEHGLEPGEVTVSAERVQLLTAHGAKGLEWQIVAVPGLVDGVFPAAPRGVDWTRFRQLLPAPLRGDAADLPSFTLDGAASRKEVADRLVAHNDQVRERHGLEERRLGYVALTRARATLLASAHVWDDGKLPRAVSPFLDELRDQAEVDGWFVPAPGARNPRLAQTPSARWPVDPLGAARADVEAGAALVRAALAEAERSGVDRAGAGEAGVGRSGGRCPVGSVPAPDGGAGSSDAPDERSGPSRAPDEDAGARAEWRRDADLLLEERAEQRRSGPIAVPLPGALSVSALVALRRDPDELARRLRRPLPARPAPLARRGTSFHSWLEQRWSAQTLLDLDELPGAADATAVRDEDLAALRAAFERSAWAARSPIEVEVPFEMALDNGPGPVIRGRMDAVFADPDGGYTVVDWKTGARPGGAEAEAAAVQLAAYRLAWSRLSGAPLENVRAAFHYVRANETVAPADLLDAAGLRDLMAAGG